ncbi:hypothetical protein [Spirosoma telluris]|uniref:hypothetical protein n=1 Tax=Spirosoma telluris TaxID=2183553 RepID=UPI002FC2D51A
MKPYTLLALGLSLFVLNACTPDTNVSVSASQPVIEAYLVPGQPILVKVARQVPFQDDTTGQGQPLTDLNLSISVNAKSYALQSRGNGSYQASSDVPVQADKPINWTLITLVTMCRGVPLYPVGRLVFRPIKPSFTERPYRWVVVRVVFHRRYEPDQHIH